MNNDLEFLDFEETLFVMKITTYSVETIVRLKLLRNLTIILQSTIFLFIKIHANMRSLGSTNLLKAFNE